MKKKNKAIISIVRSVKSVNLGENITQNYNTHKFIKYFQASLLTKSKNSSFTGYTEINIKKHPKIKKK